MRRPTRGATTHPTLTRPGMGYGRALRPRPGPVEPAELGADVAAFLRGEVVEVIELDRSSVTSAETLH